MSGLRTIISAAATRRATVFVLRSRDQLLIAPAGYDPLPGAHLTFVSDNPSIENDESRGPGAFDDVLLTELLRGAVSVVTSGPMHEKAGDVIANLMALAAHARVVFIDTAARHHVEWTRRLKDLSGVEPAIHVTAEDVDLSEFKVQFFREGHLH